MTVKEVADAWNAVRQHGCIPVGYNSPFASAVPDALRMRAEKVLPLRDLGSFQEYGRSYALSFPSRTTDGDLARLAVSLARLPNLRTLDLAGTRISGEGLKHITAIPGLEAVFVDRLAVGDKGLNHLAEIPSLVWIEATGIGATDDGAIALAKLPRLEVLRLAENPKLSNAGFAALGAVKTLRRLDLAGTSVALGGELRGFDTLARLDLSGAPVADAGVKSLAALKDLVELNLSQTNVTGPGLADLATLPKLAVLRLTGAPITDAGAAGLAPLVRLQELDLDNILAEAKSGAPPARPLAITDAALVEVGKCKSLRRLSLARTAITGAGLAHLAELPDLAALGVQGSDILDDHFLAVAGLKSLRSLDASYTALTGRNFRLLRDHEELQSMNLEGSWVDDNGVPGLSAVRRLHVLNLRWTPITDVGLGHVAALPLASLNVSKTKVSTMSVKAVSGMSSLRSLTLEETALAGSADRLRASLPKCSIVSKAAKPPTAPPVKIARVPVE